MTPVTQTILDTDDPARQGNCLQAAIASILDLPLDDVPHFVQQHEDGAGDWLDLTCAWLAERGLVLRLTQTPRPGEHYLIFGRTERGTSHVAIYRDGHMVHDPHPSGAGLLAAANPYAIRAAQTADTDAEAEQAHAPVDRNGRTVCSCGDFNCASLAAEQPQDGGA